MFEQFDSSDKAAWIAQLEKDLKGRPYEELVWQWSKTTQIEPFYQRVEVETAGALAHKPNNDWTICELIEHDSTKEGNRMALEALMGGANALCFVINRGVSAAEMADLLANIELPYIDTHFFYTGKKVTMAQKKLEHFYNLARAKGYNTELLGGSLQIAPLGAEPNWEKVKSMVNWANIHLPNFKILTINGSEFHTSDENVSEALAQTIHRANKTLVELTQLGLDLTSLNKHICFQISVGKSYFINIAKIRALKLLWLNVLKAHGMATLSMPPIMANFHSSCFDDNENTNMIRITTMALSAATGGVDSLTVLPATAMDSSFGRRIARNVQHILKMESYVDKVTDPAAGAYYIEKLTQQIAQDAWDKFKTSNQQ